MLVIGPLGAKPQVLPETLTDDLRDCSEVILHSVSPEPSRDSGFMGYGDLGSTTLSGPPARSLTQAVLQGLQEATEADRAACFAPRHGLVLPRYRLLVCYACGSAVAEDSEGHKLSLATTLSGNEACSRAVYQNGLEWQGWQPVGSALRHARGHAVVPPPGYQGRTAAGTETLLLQRVEATEQAEPLPGEVVLTTEDGDTRVLSTQWLDHARTPEQVWLLVGRTGQYDRRKNSVTYGGSKELLDSLADLYREADHPGRLRAEIKLRPQAEERMAHRVERELRRDGFQLNPVLMGKDRLLTGIGRREGLEVRATVGVVQTPHGPVLLMAEIPVAAPQDLSGLIDQLRQSAQ